jgi:hypothetical protein
MLRLCFSLILLLAGSAAHADSEAMNRVLKQKPSLAGFDMCHSGSCADISRVSLSAAEWQTVIDEFDPAPMDAEDERSRISNAIGALEKIVGNKTGTENDFAGTFGAFASRGQLDCNDEAANSNTYIKMMMQAGLIRFHEIADTKIRHFFFNGWPHTTAAIRDKQSGKYYAVDSWFYDNGIPAEILPLEIWKSGWMPAQSFAH